MQKNNDQRVSITFVDTNSNGFSKYSPAKAVISVPSSVKLFLRPFVDNTYLLRVQNFNRDPVTVSLPSEWSTTEYTLSANQLLSDWKSKQLKWNTKSSEEKSVIT